MNGNYLRTLRTEKHMTMKELGEACGVHESAISLYETGKREPKVSVAKKIAEALGIQWYSLYD